MSDKVIQQSASSLVSEHPYLTELSSSLADRLLDADDLGVNSVNTDPDGQKQMYIEAISWAAEAYSQHKLYIANLASAHADEARRIIGALEDETKKIILAYERRKLAVESTFRRLVNAAFVANDAPKKPAVVVTAKDDILEKAKLALEVVCVSVYGTKKYHEHDDESQRPWLILFVILLTIIEIVFNLPSFSLFAEGGWIDVLAALGVVVGGSWIAHSAALSRAILNGFDHIEDQYDTSFGPQGYKYIKDGKEEKVPLIPLDLAVYRRWKSWMIVFVIFTISLISYRAWATYRDEDSNMFPLLGSVLAALFTWGFYIMLTHKSPKITKERRQVYLDAKGEFTKIKNEHLTPTDPVAVKESEQDPLQVAKEKFNSSMALEIQMFREALARLGAAPSSYLVAGELFVMGRSIIWFKFTEWCMQAASSARDHYRVTDEVLPDPDEQTLRELFDAAVPSETVDFTELFDAELIDQLSKLQLPMFENVQIHTTPVLDAGVEISLIVAEHQELAQQEQRREERRRKIQQRT